jgi:hypothetical protein
VQFQLGRSEGFPFHATNFPVQLHPGVRTLFQGNAIEIGGIGWQLKVISLSDCQVIEIGSHIVSDRNNKCRDFRKVTLVTLIGAEQLIFNHVPIVAEEL